MAKGYVKIIITLEGKYVGQARLGNNDGTEVTRYETPEYLTVDMAVADANCWKAFHMTGENSKREYSIDVSDVVETDQRKNDVPTRVWTGPEFAQWLSKAQAKFPAITFRCSQEYQGRRMTGNDFFLILAREPGARGRVFRVKKSKNN